MRTRCIALFMAALQLSTSGCTSDKATTPATTPSNNASNGVDALQGTWLITGYGAKGDPIEPSSDDKEPWVIKGNQFTFFDNIERNDIKFAAALKVDPGKQPAHIDFIYKDKDGKEAITRGIYSLKGDELTVCVPERFEAWEPENRPTEFKSTTDLPGKNSGFSVYVLKKK